MEKKLDEIENKLSQKLDGVELEIRDIRNMIYHINKSQSEIQVNLKEHMLRTSLAEENIKIIREELKPVKAHIGGLNWLYKAILALGAISVAAWSVITLSKEFL